MIGIPHVPSPAQFSSYGIVPLNYSRWRVALLPVENLVANHHDTPYDRRRRRDRKHPRIVFANSDCRIDLAIVSEVSAGGSGFGVDRDHPRIQRTLDDSRRAKLRRI